MTSLSITLIGAGNMGAALVGGWLKASDALTLTLVDPGPSERVTEWVDAGKVSLNPEPSLADILVIAVKPQIFGEVADSLQHWIGPDTLVLSVMAGIQIDMLQKRLGTERVIRAIPNTPGLIGQGVTLLAAPKNANDADIAMARQLLEPLGVVEGPMEESRLSAGMAISACSPAYVFLLAEAMAAAGEAEGLDPELAGRIARQAIQGSAALMASSDETFKELRRAVTSPGGTTQAALDVLMDENGIPSLMRKAVKAAILRDRELARDIRET
ncbi:MAG: pyrroline-5-carboxylate reductase [Hyphomonadaceae bacterium]